MCLLRDPNRCGAGAHGVFAADLELEILEEEIAILAPAAGRMDDHAPTVVDPLTYQPGQRLELLVAGGWLTFLVASHGHEPLALALHVNHCVAIVLGRLVLAGGLLGRAFFDGEVRTEEA